MKSFTFTSADKTKLGDKIETEYEVFEDTGGAENFKKEIDAFLSSQEGLAAGQIKDDAHLLKECWAIREHLRIFDGKESETAIGFIRSIIAGKS